MSPNRHTRNSYTLRPPVEADIPALVDLQNDCLEETLGVRSKTPEEIRVGWSDPGFDVAASSRVAVDPNGQLVGCIAVYSAAPYVRNYVDAFVHPTKRGRGIGALLTRWSEQRVCGLIPKAPPDARVSIESGALSTFAPEVNFLRAQGYAHIRSFYEMRIELASPPPEPAWPTGITVRSMIANQEEEAVYRADAEAFRDHWGHVEQPFEEDFPRWLHFVRNDPYYDPAFFFLAMDGDQIAGLSLCTPKDKEDPDMAWVHTLAVLRPWRRQGLALALLHHSFGEFYRHGVYKAGLGVDAGSLTGATRLYEKSGMSVYRQFDRYKKVLRPGRDLSTQSLAE